MKGTEFCPPQKGGKGLTPCLYCFVTILIVLRLLAIQTLLKPNRQLLWRRLSPTKVPACEQLCLIKPVVAFPPSFFSLCYQQAVVGCFSTFETIPGHVGVLFVGVTSRWDFMYVLISNTNSSSAPPASFGGMEGNADYELGGWCCKEFLMRNAVVWTRLLVWANKDNLLNCL